MGRSEKIALLLFGLGLLCSLAASITKSIALRPMGCDVGVEFPSYIPVFLMPVAMEVYAAQDNPLFIVVLACRAAACLLSVAAAITGIVAARRAGRVK